MTTGGRAEFIRAVRGAVETGRGYAAGKLGNTERMILQYPVVLGRVRDPAGIHAFELALRNHALRHSGVFPAEPAFLRRFSDAYSDAIPVLDCIGLWPERPAGDMELLHGHDFHGLVVPFHDQEPDRSIPSDESLCYLSSFAGRRVLLVSPFASLLRERANRATFEAVWANIGKPWFEPAAVEAVELPYGFSPSTWKRYPDALALLDEVLEKIDAVTYDIALIATGGIAIPIAAALKARGKVALSLGGHLQVLFGVSGARWRGDPFWSANYFNEAWIDMPDEHKPGEGESDENYW